MWFFDFFKPKADTISKVVDSTNNLVKTVGSFITNDLPPEQKGQLISKYLDITQTTLSYQRDIITTEMQGNWLQRSWRPILMFLIITIIGMNYLLLPILGLLHVPVSPLPLPKELWTLLQIGLGGYIVGRSGEKIVENLRKKP